MAGLYGGGSYYDDAYNKKYGGNTPTFADNYAQNTSWFQKKGLLQDQALIDKGYQYFQGSADTSAEALMAAGYQTAGSLGSTLAGGQNAWYLAPQKSAAQAPAPSGGGGFSLPKPVPPKKVEPPKPVVTNTKVGSAIGGNVSETLGSKNKSVFDEGAKGLKGLTIGKPVDTTAPTTDKERKRFGLGLFNVGLTAPSTGTGVQV
jgi:hypothetical protein